MTKPKEGKIEGVAVNLRYIDSPKSIISREGVAFFKSPKTILTKKVAWEGYGIYWTIAVPKEFI